MSKLIKIDFENNAEQWWDAARECKWHEVPKGCRDLDKAGVTEVRVSDATAKAFVEWASELPGWSGGPDHAPHPFTIQDV